MAKDYNEVRLLINAGVKFCMIMLSNVLNWRRCYKSIQYFLQPELKLRYSLQIHRMQQDSSKVNRDGLTHPTDLDDLPGRAFFTIP